MADRTITVRLRAEVNQAVDGMKKVGGAADFAADKISNSGKKADGAFSQMAKHAAQNERAWTTAGTALTAAGGAILGLGVASGKAGIEFNSLKQTSGAALKSVLGSAEAASRQMDKLNQFGRDSWVMRDVLIRAQQQMTGFGVETQKVIPYLDGLQEAVAAAGGDSQTFEELARVMAKVKSQGKLTAETFNEFGSRGVDAATIIGEQMGKTGQEIRDSVTEGSLDADQALDALAEGMKTKFDGATENLRNTFRGAMDNLSAAWRDLSATMAEPLVGPDGGGLAVAGLNALTDAISDVQDKADGLPNGVKGTILALGGITGAASLAAGGFLLLMPRIVETKKAFDTLSGAGGVVGATTKAVGGLGRVLGVAAAAWLAFEGANILANKATEASIPGIEKINSELSELAKNGGNLDGAFGGGNAFTDWMGHSQAVNNMGDALEVIGRHAESGTLGIAKFREAITPGAQELEKATAGIEAYDEGLADLVNSGKMDQAQDAFKNIAELIPDSMPQSEVMERFAGYREALQGTANDLDVTGLSEKDYYEWMRGNVPAAIQEATDAQQRAADGYAGMSEAAQAAQEHLEEVHKGLVESGEGFVDFTAKATDSKTTLQEWIKDLEDQVEAQEKWFDNLSKLSERGVPQALLDELMSMGPQGAKIVKDLANSSDADLGRVKDAFKTTGKQARDFADDAASIPKIELDADPSKLKKQIGDSKDRLKELEKLPTTPEVDAQITLLKEKIAEAEAKLEEVEKGKTTAKVDADTSKAKEDVNGFKSWFKNNSSVTMSVWAKIKETFTGTGDRAGAGDSIVRDKPKKKATGGPIFGPGSGTSDSVPAMLSNGEHVWTADEVRKAGGHGVIEAMRAAVSAGNYYAKGGAVGSAERRLASAQKQLDSISRSGQKRTAEDRRKEAAQKRVEQARAALDRAKEQEARRERVASLRSDLKQDVRRGGIRDQVTGSLSGGYSAVDRLLGLGGNEDLSRASRSKASSSARKFEANLKNLYAQADRIDEKLKAAQDKAQELNGIKDSVVSSLLGGRDLDVGTFQTQQNGVWSSHSNLGQAAKGLTADVGAMKAFAGKLKKLVELGVPGAIVQEIAQAGVAEGSNMADSFIDATNAERKSYLGAWSEYEKYANQAGQYVTEGFHKGGAAAADGVVKGLEGKKKNVEKAIANLAKVMEATFKNVLGIRSPSRVMSELGGFTAEGLVQGMLGGVADVESAAAMLGAAAVPSTSMSMDVGVNPVMADDEGMAGLAMQDMSATTLEAMQAMGIAVSDGFAGMLADTQTMQAGMLSVTQESNLGQLTDTQIQQAAMLLNTQTKNAAMLSDVQTQQEAMRANVLAKQTGQRTAATEQQEAMRLMLVDKQSQMKSRSAEDFEALKQTTGSKFGAMRSETDTTMAGTHKDYSGRLTDLKGLNKSGFESILSTSDKNMRAVRDGIDGEMAAAKPELGGRMNNLIGVLSSFTSSVNKAFKDVGVDLKAPQSLKFATGGVMPGYTPGRDVHQFRSPTAGELYLSGGEAIMRPEFTRAVGGEQGVKELNKAARQGGDNVHHLLSGQGFATGGVLGRIPGVNAFADSGVWRNLWAITKAQFPGAQLTSAYRGGSITASGNTSHHSRGNAIDVSPSMDIFNFWRNKYGANLAELIYSPANGKQIKNGRNYMYQGAVRSMHYNHVHIAAVRALSDAMAGGLPGMGGEMSHPFLDKAKVTPGDDLEKSYAQAAKKLLKGIVGKHTGMLPDGIGEQLGKGIMAQASEGLIGKAKKFGKTAGAGDFGNVASGPIKQMAKQMLENGGMGDQFGDLDWLLKRESGWNPKAQNPTSTAYGLFQFLNSTWGTVGGSKTSDPKKQLEYGLKYIQQRYGDVRGARSFWERNHWYEDGTNSAKKGWAVVGEDGPELVQLNGGEKVKNASETRKILAENRTFIPNQRSGFDSAALVGAVSSAIQANGINANDLAQALNGVRMTFQADGQQFTGAVTAVVGTGYDESRSRLAKASQKIGAR